MPAAVPPGRRCDCRRRCRAPVRTCSRSQARPGAARPWRQGLGVAVQQRGQRPDRQERQGDDELEEDIESHDRSFLDCAVVPGQIGPESATDHCGVPAGSRRALPVPAIEFRISVSAWTFRRL